MENEKRRGYNSLKDKDDNMYCIYCGEKFETKQGLGSHKHRKHGLVTIDWYNKHQRKPKEVLPF